LGQKCLGDGASFGAQTMPDNCQFLQGWVVSQFEILTVNNAEGVIHSSKLQTATLFSNWS
jgi:hypothetical protein